MIKQLAFLLVVAAACSQGVDKSRMEKAKQEIVRTEHEFAAMADAKGLSEAFSFYADSAAALSRGSYVIHGKDSVRKFYQAPRFKTVKLEWKPDFVEVAASADLGYTYGKYVFTTRDSTGREIRSKGIFHTVWKKQADGQWRFVWD